MALVLGLLAGWAVLDRLLMPSARWFIRSRADQGARRGRAAAARSSIRPFQQVRRQALIDRLVFDDKVQQAAQAFAEARGMPREVALDQVRALRARDRAGLQRLHLLPHRLLDRQDALAARCTACASATPTTPG
ncbi:MAG: hypothetical protein MZW92_35845 [Comamonadaceae bacterium]|nr:hypothetical protein [Comamonadaceae bacterium]